MPTSNDNQDYGESDEKNSDKTSTGDANELTTNNLKGKKVDADLSEEKDKPLEEKN